MTEVTLTPDNSAIYDKIIKEIRDKEIDFEDFLQYKKIADLKREILEKRRDKESYIKLKNLEKKEIFMFGYRRIDGEEEENFASGDCLNDRAEIIGETWWLIDNKCFICRSVRGYGYSIAAHCGGVEGCGERYEEMYFDKLKNLNNLKKIRGWEYSYGYEHMIQEITSLFSYSYHDKNIYKKEWFENYEEIDEELQDLHKYRLSFLKKLEKSDVISDKKLKDCMFGKEDDWFV